ncbi:MAG: PAS domain S-box protein [Bacteroidota bacterium]
MNLEALSIIDKVSPIVIFKADKEGKCIYISQKWTEISGYSFEESIGDGWISAVHPEDKTRTLSGWKPKTASQVSITEYRIITKHGDIKWLVTRVAAEISENDQVIGYIGSATDITERKLAEHSLQASEEMNRKLVENSPNAIVIQELDTTIVFVNKRAIELLGARSEKEILGKSTKNFIHPDDQPGIAARFKQIVSTNQRGEPYTFRINGFRNNRFLGESIAVPFHWKEKKVVLLVIRDVTEERENLEKVADSEKRLKQFIQYAPVAVAMFDKNMNYVGCSHKWLKDWWKKEEEVSIDDVIGKNHYDLFSDVSNYWKKVHQRVLKGAYEVNEEDFFVDEKGKTHWLRWEARPWRRKDDDIGGVIIFTEFITERKKAENDLKVVADQLLESNQELQQFAYITSHNLRAPIVNLDTLLGFYDPKIGYNEDNAQVFDKIIKSVDQLKSSLNDLIQLVDIRETKSLRTREINFMDSLNQVLRAVETQINTGDTELTYNFDKAPSVTFEASVLESILQNLITNALKYRRAAPLHINLYTYNSEEYVVLKISDNGIGMDLDVVGTKLFGMYQRFNDTKEGKGLGLYIVKSQIESMGGKIEVESTPNEGSTFIIYFKKN